MVAIIFSWTVYIKLFYFSVSEKARQERIKKPGKWDAIMNRNNIDYRIINIFF